MARRSLALVSILVVASAAASGCGDAAGREPVLQVAKADRDLLGRWTDGAGRVLPDGSSGESGILVIRSRAGSTTCSDDHITVFLELAWPVGRALDTRLGVTDDMVPRFVRDMSGSSLKFSGESEVDARLPESAVAADLHLNGNTVHRVPDDPRAVYVTRPNGVVERWPRLLPDVVCAG